MVFLLERPRLCLGLVGIVMVLPGVIDLNVRPALHSEGKGRHCVVIVLLMSDIRQTATKRNQYIYRINN